MEILTNDDIRQLITMREAIGIVRETLAQFSNKEAIMPQRASINIKEGKGTTLFMPAYLPHSGGLGVKIVGIFPDNKSLGLPTISGVILLNNSQTGEVSSIMEAGYITALRTGAASGVATDLLANEGATKVGLFGAGVQARSQLQAIMEVRNIAKVFIYDVDRGRAEMLAQEMEELKGRSCTFIPVDAPEKAVSEADIIITATTSKTPVFNGRHLKEGTHINAIGSFKPQHREIDDETIKRAKIFVDSYTDCLEEAGDIIIPLTKGLISKEDIYAEVGEVLLGRKRGRENSKQTTLYKSVGLAVLDIAVAQRVYFNWKEKR